MNRHSIELESLKQLYRQEAKKLYHSIRHGAPLGALQTQKHLVAQLWSRLMAREGTADGRHGRNNFPGLACP